MDKQLSLKGYVHNVSTVKHSRKGSTQYFNFSLQVNDTRKRKAVCYDPGKQKVLKVYEESSQPVQLLNVSEKPSIFDPSDQHLIVGQKSRIEPAKKTDVLFHYDNSIPKQQEATPITIEHIQNLDDNELVTVKGILTLSKDSVRDVIKKDGFLASMLNRSTITDNTGTIPLTLWGDLIQQVNNHKSYSITHARIKRYDNAKYLTTTPSTTVTPIEENFTPPTKELFDSLFDTKTIFVDEIRLAETLKTWLSCTKCQSLLADEAPNMETNIIKCPNCSAVQPVSSCTTSASVRIAVRDTAYELIWLKAFTRVLQQILQLPPSQVNLHSSEEDVYRQLFNVKNFTVYYSNTSNIIKEIKFESTTDND